VLDEEFFEFRSQASQAAARHVASHIKHGLAKAPAATIVVSGGSTPEECFGLLSDTHLPWDKLHVLPSDERCVPLDHEASNAGMICRSLLRGRAATATLVPLYDAASLAEDPCEALCARLDALPLPFSVCLLGMGTDGHFASLFPGCDRLAEGLDPDGEARCMRVRTAACPHPRMSLTMSTLTQSSEILLLFFGNAKRETYEQAKRTDSDYPLSVLLNQRRAAVRAIWAP
jgi:6-phosphogluconolactonase